MTLPGIKVLLEGGSGTGKTYSLRTLLDAGLTPLCLFTENSFDVLGDTDPKRFHWRYIPPSKGGLPTLIENAQKIAVMGPEQLQKINDTSRSKTNTWMEMLLALQDFKCDRTGERFGNVAEWGTDKVLVIDSLSGLTIAATKAAVGEKYAMTQPEYQIAMKTIENLINYLCTGVNCHVVVTSHVEREVDEVLGGVRLFPSTLGRKLAPVLPRFFTDVIMAKRQGTKFLWDTADPNADLKVRNAPISSELPPSFAPLVEAWKKRGGAVSVTPAANQGKSL